MRALIKSLCRVCPAALSMETVAVAEQAFSIRVAGPAKQVGNGCGRAATWQTPCKGLQTARPSARRTSTSAWSARAALCIVSAQTLCPEAASYRLQSATARRFRARTAKDHSSKGPTPWARMAPARCTCRHPQVPARPPAPQLLLMQGDSLYAAMMHDTHVCSWPFTSRS